jgi:hypothetical protein
MQKEIQNNKYRLKINNFENLNTGGILKYRLVRADEVRIAHTARLLRSWRVLIIYGVCVCVCVCVRGVCMYVSMYACTYTK